MENLNDKTKEELVTLVQDMESEQIKEMKEHQEAMKTADTVVKELTTSVLVIRKALEICIRERDESIEVAAEYMKGDEDIDKVEMHNFEYYISKAQEELAEEKNAK